MTVPDHDGLPVVTLPASDPADVLTLLGVRPSRVRPLADVPLGNGNWLVETDGGEPSVLRRYHPETAPEDLRYEHAVLAYVAGAGWVVPTALTAPVRWHDRWWCLTRHVPGQGTRAEDARQCVRRGRDLARLHLALRGAADRIGPRPGWRPQHTAVTIQARDRWEARVEGLASASPRLAAWSRAAAAETRAALAAVGADDLPVMVVHGDFAAWNVHYEGDVLAGVIDFELTHVDSRPYELAIARGYRAPDMVAAYRAELDEQGWPLSELEEAAIDPVYRAFRVGVAAAEMHDGDVTGRYDLAMIERQLARTGTPPP